MSLLDYATEMIEKRIEQLNHKIDAEQAEAESEKAALHH